MKEGKIEESKIESKEKSLEEINEMMNEKALDTYRDNVIIRFTNESFLKDVFETKAEFKGEGMFLLKDHEDWDKYCRKEKDSHELIPKGKASLGTFIDKVYSRFYSKRSHETKKEGDFSKKMEAWSLFIGKATDWISNASERYVYDLEEIKKVKSESKNKDDFYKNLREYFIDRSNNIKDKDLKEFFDRVMADESFLRKPDNLREYFHIRANLFEPSDKTRTKQKTLKEGRDIFRMYNIGLLIDFDAVESSGHWARKNWCRFKKPEEIDLKKDLKGIISVIRDRVFEKKLIEEMEELTKDNPELRVPIFDLDGNQIYPIRRKREEIEKKIEEKPEN